MLIKKNAWLAVFGSTLIGASVALGQGVDSNQLLLQLLVKKGIITQDEATQLKNEVAAAPAPAPAYAPAPGSSAPAGSSSVPATAVAATPSTSPLAFKIGAADFSPVGFLDFTGVYRSTNTNGAIGTGFNSIPFSNSAAGQLSETKFSAQNSRLGLRVDSKIDDTKILGYVETDFLGNAASTLNVSSNAATLRMRVYFADIKHGDLELLAGQDWSLLTPNRKGISPMPSDIFYSMDMDTNYQAGLTWARQPQIRLTYHASDEFTFAASAENPDQYTSGAVTYPTGFNTAEVDNNGNGPNAPSPVPDFVAKAAFDTKAVNGLPWHAEVAGLLSNYKINTYTAGVVNSSISKSGTGATAGVSLELVKGLTFIGTGFYSYGGGRYIQGLAPDFIVTAPDASGAYGMKLVKAESGILGLEWAAIPTDTVFAYASTVHIGQAVTTQANGTQVGYGYVGSANSNNKTIDEYTLGNTYTFWKSANLGALQLIGQLSYVDRTPWYVAAGSPSKSKSTMVFVDLRYVLP